MACYHPMLRRPTGRYEVGKDGLYRASFRVEYMKTDVPDLLTPLITDEGEVLYSQLVPCGKCIGCRAATAREWTSRILMEMATAPTSDHWFLTLTYDSVPRSPDGFATLRIRDYQLFLKRLRHRFPCSDVRYFLCGEYSPSYRPHYHAILFNVPLDDLVFYRKDADGYSLYRSAAISDAWRLGLAVVGAVDAASAAYTAGYCVKKLNLSQDALDDMEIQREFRRMSTHPAIGSAFFSEELYRNDRIAVPGGGLARPPRYFDKLLSRISPATLEQVKDRRVLRAQLVEQAVSEESPLNFSARRRAEEAAFLRRVGARDVI